MNLGEFKYYQPKTVKEACQIKEKLRDVWFLAGGAFLVPFMRRLKDSSDGAKNIISLRSIGGISEITLKRNTLTIGAMAALDDLAQDTFIKEKLPLLPEVLSYFSSSQIRNMATVGGNICCGVPWVDLPAALLVLGAELELANSKSTTAIPFADFIKAPKLILKNMLLVSIKIKIPQEKLRYSFVRIPKNTEADIPLVSVCIALADGKKDKQDLICAVNFGNRFSQRLTNIENAYKEKQIFIRWDDKFKGLVEKEIETLEGNEYRRQVIVSCVRRAVEKLNFRL